MLGSLRATSENKQYYYYPYGKRKDVTYSGESTRQGFIGKEHDKELGLAEHGVRKYDDELGRFTNPDALWEKYAGWSPYQYVANNPVMIVDGNGYFGKLTLFY